MRNPNTSKRGRGKRKQQKRNKLGFNRAHASEAAPWFSRPLFPAPVLDTSLHLSAAPNHPPQPPRPPPHLVAAAAAATDEKMVGPGLYTEIGKKTRGGCQPFPSACPLSSWFLSRSGVSSLLLVCWLFPALSPRRSAVQGLPDGPQVHSHHLHLQWRRKCSASSPPRATPLSSTVLGTWWALCRALVRWITIRMCRIDETVWGGFIIYIGFICMVWNLWRGFSDGHMGLIPCMDVLMSCDLQYVFLPVRLAQ